MRYRLMFSLMTRFCLMFAAVYLLFSLPDMFGISVAIDFVPEAGLWQRLSAYATEGLKQNVVVKFAVAFLTGSAIVFLSLWRRG